MVDVWHVSRSEAVSLERDLDSAMSDDSQTCSTATHPGDELELRDDLRYVEALQELGMTLYDAVPNEVKDWL